MESHRKGELTEAIVIAELKRRAIPVSVPFGDNERYDLVIETDSGDLLRIQVKTGWLSDGKVQFHGSSQHTNSSGNVYKTYDGEVDFFVVFCHELETLYLISEGSFKTSRSLRVDEPRRRDRSIRWAEEYEFDNQWPVETPNEDCERLGRDTLRRVVGKFRDEGVAVASMINDCGFDLLAETSKGTFRRIRVQPGWDVNGRIRFNPSPSKKFDYLAIFHHESDVLYIIPSNDYDKTISLRVDDPDQTHASINWAKDYEFPDLWP